MIPLLMVGSVVGALTLDARRGQSGCEPGHADEVTVCARSDLPSTSLPIRVNGRAGTVLVEPSGPDDLQCNGPFVAAAGIVRRQYSFMASVGNVGVGMFAAAVPVLWLGRQSRRIVVWPTRTIVAGADCVIGPLKLGYGRVRFLLGSPRAGSTTAYLPFFPERRDDHSRVYARFRVGRHDLGVRFELEYDGSVLTAPAVRVLAPILGMTVVGPTEATPIMYGVDRPARSLRLNEPLLIGNLRVQHPYGRILDYGDASGVSAVDPADTDPDDVIVAGKTLPPGKTRLIRVGHDDLAQCSSIEVDVVHRRFALQC